MCDWEIDSLELLSSILYKTDSQVELSIVTEVNVSPNTFNISIRHCLEYVGVL